MHQLRIILGLSQSEDNPQSSFSMHQRRLSSTVDNPWINFLNHSISDKLFNPGLNLITVSAFGPKCLKIWAMID